MTPLSPMLCERIIPTEVERYLNNPDYIYEEKYDGTRCIAIRDWTHTNLTLQNRRGEDITDRFPEIVEELRKFKTDMILDGEIVVLNGNGVPNFSLLAQRSHLKDPFMIKILSKKIPAIFMAFDILELDGKNLRDVKLVNRKETLAELVTENNQIELATWYEHSHADIPKAFSQILALGGEGMVAKRKDSKYVDGSRSTDWIKLKKYSETDAIICAYTQGEGKRDGVFGALVLGQFDNSTIRYIGRVGTGFNDTMLGTLTDMLESIRLPSSAPTYTYSGFQNDLQFVNPIYVVEIRYMERTKTGILRHPVFSRLKMDKRREDCLFETA